MHPGCNVSQNFLLPAEYTPHIHKLLFIHSSVDGPLSHFHFLALVNNVAVNIGTQVPVFVPVFNSFRHIPRSRITGSYGNSMFNFWRKYHLFFPLLAPFYPILQVLQFFTPSPTIVFPFFYYSHSRRSTHTFFSV